MKRLTTILFFLLIIEIAIGGGGRLTAIGPVSLRMILFVLALLISAFYFIRGRKIPADYTSLLVFFSIASIIGILIGLSSGANRSLLWEDIKPLLYFLILPFFYFAVSDIKILNQTASVFKVSGIVLTAAFFAILLSIHLHLIPFLSLYKPLILTEEFFFRGELTFTYKGFLFLCIGFLFFHFTGGKYKALFMTLLCMAILFTVTRGFWLALFSTYAFYYFVKPNLNVRVKGILFASLAITIVLQGQVMITKTSKTIDQLRSTNSSAVNLPPRNNLLGDRAYSDKGRFQQIKEVMAEVTPLSILIGHGFGNGIPARPVHMEISYLEIIHKQGILGLAFWACLFWLLFKKYRSAPESGLRDAFFFSSLFIFLQSLTNQYMNNPIGLSVILLSMVSLDMLQKPIIKEVPEATLSPFEPS